MKLAKSIKWRLQIWYGLILVVVLAGLGFTAYQLERDRVFRHADGELQRRLNVLVQTVRRATRPLPRRPPLRAEDFNPPPEAPEDFPPGDAPPLAKDNFRLQPRDEFLFDATITNGFYYIMIGDDGKEIARSPNAPANSRLYSYRPPGIMQINQAAAKPPLKEDRLKYDSPDFKYDESPPGGVSVGQPPPPYLRGSFREISIALEPNDRTHGIQITVGRNMLAEFADLRRTALRLTSVGFAILLVGLGGGWWLVRRSLRPIAEIGATAAKISAGDLSQRINVAETESELGELASVLNSTFARLEAAFAQQRQFASDAAHELRTPVTVILTQTQTALARERDAASYKQTVEACQRAAQRMRRLIEALLELARFDAGQETLRRNRFDLAQTVADSMELVQTLAEANHVKLVCEAKALEITGDAERLGQVVTNLLTNAIQYNQPNGQVNLRMLGQNGLAVLEISDTGQGIAPEDLPRVFERFYRADKSRTGAGNSGLGLSICKAIVEAHGGTIEVTSEPGQGTIFTVRLPV